MSGSEASAEAFELNNSVPTIIQSNLKSLLEKDEHKNGIWGSTFQKEYKKSFQKYIDYEKYGYGSLEHMLDKLPYLAKVVNYVLGDYKVFAANAKVPMKGDALVLNKTDVQLRPSVMQYGEEISRRQLPATNNLISIKVSQIYDPSKFWFYSAEDDNENQLVQMMIKLQGFYGLMGKEYLMSSYQIKGRLYCVTVFDNKFHRGIIVDVLPELVHSVKVFFIDYGTVDTVFVRNLYFLHEAFKEPYAMAMRGQMALATPCGLNMPWSKEAIAMFEHLVNYKALKAQVASMKPAKEANIYVLNLFDTAGDNRFPIPLQLIQKGLAISEEQQQETAQSIPEFINNSQPMHLVPTFEDLESGIAPTRSELKLLQQIYPDHKLLEKYRKSVH